MELVMPTAIGAQLGTLPDAEHSVMLARLQLLANDPQRLGPDVKASASDPGLWTVRLSGRMLALVRAEGEQLKVLAIAPRDQLAPYLKPKGQRAA